MTDVPARVATLPSWLITQLAGHAHRLVADGLADVGGKGYYVRLLTTLDEYGPASQADLGRRTGIHFSDLVAVLNELADRGAISRTPDPADRRRNIVTITPAGRQQLTALGVKVAAIQDELLAPLNTDERAELVRLLGRLLAHHGRSPHAPGAA